MAHGLVRNFCTSTILVLVIMQLPVTILADDGAAGKDFCDRIFEVSNRTIIKATDSIAQGANYLDSVKVSSRRECQERCCDTPKCNIVVLEEKPEKRGGDCFMFDCGTTSNFQCVFSVHDNFVSMGMMIDRKDLEKSKFQDQDKHELDLNRVSVNNKKGSGAPAQPTTTPSNQPIPEPENQVQSQVDYSIVSDPGSQNNPGFGQQNQNSNYNNNNNNNINNNNNNVQQQQQQYRPNQQSGRPRNQQNQQSSVGEPQSVVPNNVGRQNNGQAVQRVSNNVPRPVQQQQQNNCGSNQFQCDNGECIAIYDMCNDIAQCSDSSDEGAVCKNQAVLNQPQDGQQQQQQQQQQVNRQNWQQKQQNWRPQSPARAQQPPPVETRYPDYYASPDNNLPNKQDRRPNTVGQTGNRGIKTNQGTDGSYTYNVDTYDPSSSNNNGAVQQPVPQQQQQQQQQPSNTGNSQVQVGRQQPAPAQTRFHPSTADQQPAQPPKPAVVNTPLTKNGAAPVGQSQINVVPVASSTENGGTSLAALLLGIGLSVLAVLVVFLSCRLRRARRRIRKGAHAFDGEGELLINGLYL